MGVQYGAGASSVTSAPDLFPRGLAELEQRREFQRMGGTQFLWARTSSRKFPCSSREIGADGRRKLCLPQSACKRCRKWDRTEVRLWGFGFLSLGSKLPTRSRRNIRLEDHSALHTVSNDFAASFVDLESVKETVSTGIETHPAVCNSAAHQLRIG